MSRPTTVHDLKALVLSFHSIIAIETVEEERVRSMVASAAADLRMPLFEWSISDGLTRYPESTPFSGTETVIEALRYIRETSAESIFYLKDFAPQLENAAVRRLFREVAQSFTQSRSTLVISGDPVELPRELSAMSVQLRLQLPSREELRDVVQTVVRSLRQKRNFEISLKPVDLDAILRALAGMTLDQARQAIAYAIVENDRFDADDVKLIIRKKGELIEAGGLLEYFPAEDNDYQLGGFNRMKTWLDRARVGFTAEAEKMNLEAPRGVMITGVQGCGKSLAAKFIARSWRLPLLRLDGGRLYDKYIGESEKNFRRAVELAESMAPAILWIDEIEKAFAFSSGSEDDGGLSRRLFGAFLTWLQEKKKEVFVVGAANDLFNIPPELLRKGRFDEIFFVDLPDAGEREAIFRIHLALRKQDPEKFEIVRLVDATDGFSGAEIEQAVIAALYHALHDGRSLDTDLLLSEIKATVPLSVSRAEDIERIRALARERFVPAR